MCDTDYYYIYDGQYKNHMSLYGYSDSAYETANGELPEPIQDLIDFVKQNNIDPDNLLIPMFIGDDFWADNCNGLIRYQVLKEYFNVEVVSYWDIDTFVMQLDPMRCCVVKPNEKLLSLMS